MAIHFSGKCTVVDYERLKLSRNGNPRFRVWLDFGNEERLFKTVSDGGLSYRLENFKRGDKVKATYHITKNGNRLDDLEAV